MKGMYLHGEYLEKNPMWHAEDSEWKTMHILRAMRENGLKPASICEVGCGAGEILNHLFLQMSDEVSFYGYEISPQAYELCKPKEKDRLKFKLADLLGEGEAFYDLVLCIDVVEHVEDYFGFLRALRGKGLYKLFHVPLDISVQSVMRKTPILFNRTQVGHIHYFTKETALAALEDTGYEVIDYFYTASMVDLPARTLKNLLAKIPRKLLFKVNKDLAAHLLGGFSLMVLTK